MKKIIWVLLSVVALFSCKQGKVYYQESGSVFHTLYKIKYQSDELLTDKIDKELQEFNLSLNPFNPNSILAKVNRNENVEVDQWFTDVFNKAMIVAEQSDGAFDVTAAPFINLWGFGFERKDSVSVQVIDSMKAFVGYQKIRLEGNRVIKDDPRTLLNFSAIAKGYACDVIAALLEREGVENYMVDIGGEVVVKGMNPNGRCWQIAIDKPTDRQTIEDEYQAVDKSDDKQTVNNKYQAIVPLCKPCGMATSGNYRNFYVKDGKKYAHTIDPRTGYPSEQNILSATVVTSDCMTADAYATAFMAMGLDDALKLTAKLPEIEYYFIYTDSANQIQIEMSEGIKQMIESR
ncbi:MAG: FAD:protein FMN transferase [Tannerella sp.]|jgi:thiamine biosynthesis lipoprotein|nr:FAD:protein FMN transferase [Tannerella sp.]